jgi:hypothetical protein
MQKADQAGNRTAQIVIEDREETQFHLIGLVEFVI